jgi:lipopolysaccharide/colanic/teichoic acid biosynthesis glycosyltransferase
MNTSTTSVLFSTATTDARTKLPGFRLKRQLDVVLAGLGLLVLLPLFPVVALLIKATSPGPIFFRQERVGLGGWRFKLWKLRTMYTDAEKRMKDLEHLNEQSDGVMFKIRNDPRITPIGRFLRRTSLDELPQLLNILNGDMSLVGPRPLSVRDFERTGPQHRERLKVLPGITGAWQVAGRSDIETFDEVALLDEEYIKYWTLSLDLQIIAKTVLVVLFGRGAY